MGMFDWYQPAETVNCPTCHEPVESTWQGKDGPNGLFVWRQGHRASVDQLVDDVVRWSATELSRFSLPGSFAIYADCPRGHWVVGEGRSLDSVWVETSFALTTR